MVIAFQKFSLPVHNEDDAKHYGENADQLSDLVDYINDNTDETVTGDIVRAVLNCLSPYKKTLLDDADSYEEGETPIDKSCPKCAELGYHPLSRDTGLDTDNDTIIICTLCEGYTRTPGVVKPTTVIWPTAEEVRAALP